MYFISHDWKFFLLGNNHIGERFPEVFFRDAVILKMDIIFFDDIIEKYRSDSFEFSSLSLLHIDLFSIFLILDITKYLLEHIFHRDDPSSPPMLILHECDMST